MTTVVGYLNIYKNAGLSTGFQAGGLYSTKELANQVAKDYRHAVIKITVPLEPDRDVAVSYTVINGKRFKVSTILEEVK